MATAEAGATPSVARGDVQATGPGIAGRVIVCGVWHCTKTARSPQELRSAEAMRSPQAPKHSRCAGPFVRDTDRSSQGVDEDC